MARYQPNGRNDYLAPPDGRAAVLPPVSLRAPRNARRTPSASVPVASYPVAEVLTAVRRVCASQCGDVDPSGPLTCSWQLQQGEVSAARQRVKPQTSDTRDSTAILTMGTLTLTRAAGQ